MHRSKSCLLQYPELPTARVIHRAKCSEPLCEYIWFQWVETHMAARLSSLPMAGVRIAIAWKYTYSYHIHLSCHKVSINFSENQLHVFFFNFFGIMGANYRKRIWFKTVSNTMDFIEEKNCAFANICPKYFTALLLATDWHWVESKLRKAVTRNNQSISSGPKQCYSMRPWFQISLSDVRQFGNSPTYAGGE